MTTTNGSLSPINLNGLDPDESLQRAVINQAVAIKALQASGGGGSSTVFGPTFIPATNDYAGIMAAQALAVAAGGGVVQLLSATYNIGANTIPLTSNIIYNGAGVGWDQNGVIALTSTGTLIQGDGTAPIFGYNVSDLNPWSASASSISGTTLTVGGTLSGPTTTLPVGTSVTGPNIAGGTYITAGSGSSYTVNVSQTVASQAMSGNAPYANAGLLKASLSIGGGVTNLGIINGSYGIKCGAMYQGGGNNMIIDKVVVNNCTQYGFWLENHNTPQFGTLIASGCGVGHIWIGASGGQYQNYGDGFCQKLFFQVNAGFANFNSKGVVIEGRGYQTAFNDMHFGLVSGNNQAGTTLHTDTATFDGTTAYIGVTNLANYKLDCGVTFTANLGSNILGGAPGPAYFVTYMSAATGAGVIQISQGKGGSPIVCSAAGSLTVNNWGGTLLEVGGRGDNQTSYTTGMTFSHTDLESAGTCTHLLQNCTGTKFSIDASMTHNGCVLRNLDTQAGSSVIIGNSWGGNFDVKASAQKATVTGIKPTFVATSVVPVMYVYDQIKNTFALWMNGNGGANADLSVPNNGYQAINLGSCLRMPSSNQGGGINSQNGNLINFYTSGATLNLPAINADMTGIPIIIGNPYAATATLVSNGEAIIGLGLSVTTITVPMLSHITLVADKINGGAYFWARLA